MRRTIPSTRAAGGLLGPFLFLLGCVAGPSGGPGGFESAELTAEPDAPRIVWMRFQRQFAAWDLPALDSWGGEVEALNGHYPGLPELDGLWDVGGAEDVDGDGYDDLVFHHPTGAMAVWRLDGRGEILEGYFMRESVPAAWGWRLAGVAQLNGASAERILRGTATGEIEGDGFDPKIGLDDVPDLVWQNDNGDVGLWFMTRSGGFHMMTTPEPIYVDTSGLPGTGWEVAGAGDLDADGLAELVMRRGASLEHALLTLRPDATGRVTRTTPLSPPTAESGWRISLAQNELILWRHPDGRIVAQRFAGAEGASLSTPVATSISPSLADASWEPVAVQTTEPFAFPVQIEADWQRSRAGTISIWHDLVSEAGETRFTLTNAADAADFPVGAEVMARSSRTGRYFRARGASFAVVAADSETGEVTLAGDAVGEAGWKTGDELVVQEAGETLLQEVALSHELNLFIESRRVPGSFAPGATTADTPVEVFHTRLRYVHRPTGDRLLDCALVLQRFAGEDAPELVPGASDCDEGVTPELAEMLERAQAIVQVAREGLAAGGVGGSSSALSSLRDERDVVEDPRYITIRSCYDEHIERFLLGLDLAGAASGLGGGGAGGSSSPLVGRRSAALGALEAAALGAAVLGFFNGQSIYDCCMGRVRRGSATCGCEGEVPSHVPVVEQEMSRRVRAGSCGTGAGGSGSCYSAEAAVHRRDAVACLCPPGTAWSPEAVDCVEFCEDDGSWIGLALVEWCGVDRPNRQCTGEAQQPCTIGYTWWSLPTPEGFEVATERIPGDVGVSPGAGPPGCDKCNLLRAYSAAGCGEDADGPLVRRGSNGCGYGTWASALSTGTYRSCDPDDPDACPDGKTCMPFEVRTISGRYSTPTICL